MNVAMVTVACRLAACFVGLVGVIGRRLHRKPLGSHFSYVCHGTRSGKTPTIPKENKNEC